MAAPCRPCGEGRGLCHLRRIGTRAPVPGIADVIHFCKTVTLLGRKREVVDYFLSYAALREGEYISRIHARVIWTTSTYELVDSSLTGVYVNDIRISGKVALQEGDTVTFGNPAGSSIVPGAHVRQPNSPFYFLFEHCHCHVDQMQSPCGETNLPPELLAPASAETSPPVTSSLGLVNNIAPPRAAPALASAASMAPPVTSSLPTNVLNVTLLSPEALSQPRPAAGPFSAAGDRPASQRLRSASPDYTILGEGSLVAPESSPWRTLETTRSFLLQGAPESNGSRCLSGSKEQDTGRRPDSLQWFLRENGDAGTSPAPTCPLRTAPVCLEDPAAADDDDSPCERHVNTAGLSVGVLQLTPFFQREDGDDPGSKRSTSSTEELASGDSDHEDETMEVNPSPEETAEYGMSWVSEPDAWLMGGAASGPQVTSASRMEGESPAEEHGPSFMEEPLPEGSMLETNGTAEGSNSLAVKMWPFLPATLGNACPAASSRTAGGNSSGEKPEFADGTSSGEKPEFAGGTSSGEKPEFADGTSSGEKPEFVDGTSPGEKPEFAGGTSSGEKPEFADGTSSGEKPEFAGGTSSGEKPEFAGGTSSGEKPEFAGGTSPGEKPEFADGTSPGEKPRFADGTSSGEKPEFADGTSSGEKPEFADGTSSGEKPRFADGTSSGEKPEFADGTSSGEKPELADGTSSGEKPRFADGTSSGEKPEFVDGTSSGEKPEFADGTSSGEKPRFADGTSSGEKPEFADGTSSGEKPEFADGTSSGEKPEFASRDELGSEGARAASPPRNPACGMQSGGGGDYNMNSQGSVSDGERDMEMEPLAKAGSLAMGQRVGAGAFGALEPEMGSGGPEAVGGLGNGAMEPSCAEVGTQTEWAKGRESDGAIAGAAVDGDEGLSTQVAKEAFLQQLPAASPGAFAADEHSKGECSKQGEQRPAAPFGATQETPSSEDPLEPCEEERVLAAACDLAPRDPVRMTGLIPEEPPGAPIPVAGCPAQSSTAAFGQKGEEMDAVAEKRLEHASPGCAETDKSLENRVADSTPGTEAEMAENDGPSLGAASALAAGSPGGEQQPSPKSSSNGMCQEAMDTEDPSGEEETEVKAATSSTVAAPGEDAADQKQLDGKDTLERELSPAAAAQESVCGASAEGALARGPEGNAAPSSVDSAGRKAGPLSPFHLPGDDPGEGGIPRSSGRSCAGTPLSPQTSAKEGGGRLEAGSQQGGFEDERAVSLDDESMEEEQQEVEVKGCEARAIPLVDASLEEAKMDSKQDDAQVGRLSDGQEQQGPFPDSSALSECQQESPVPVGQQNPEPDGLEPRGTDVGKEWLYSADSPTSEEVCEPDAALERATWLGPERYNKEIALSEEKDESGGFGQTPESPPCSEGSVSLPVGSVVFEMPGALKRSAAGNLPREARTDSAEVPGSWSSDELNLHISDSEAEKEESDSAWLSGTSSRSNLWGGRDALLWIPGAHLVSVAENSQACRKLSEQPPDPAPCDTVIQEARTGPLKGREMWQVGLGEETASRCESPGDRHDDALGRPQACSAEMVVGEKSPPPLAKTAAAAGAQEDQAEAGTELVPINLACLSVESSCLSQSEAEVGREDQVPGSADGLAEDACLDLAQDDRLVDDGFSSQPTVRTLAAVLEIGRTEQTESEMPTSLCSGKGERAQKTEVKEPVHPGQETELLPCQGNPRQLKDDQDSSVELSEGLDSSEYRRTLWQKEEELKRGSSRKRHFHADEDLRVSGVEDGSGLQKRLCPLDSAVVRGSASDPLTPTVATLPAPLDSEGRHDQFGRTLGNFLDQHSSQITPHLDEGEQKNRDSIAQIVRNYFKRPLCSNKPAAENEKAERLSLSPEAETGKDSPSVLETGANASCDELSSPEDQVQDASLGGQCWSAGASPPGSPAQEQGEDSARSTPESVWEAFFSEEEHFQMRVCSALRNAPSGSPVRSPDAAECALVSSEKNVDSILSDASDSSVDSDHWEPLPTQRSTIASGAGSPGLPTGGSGTAGKAAEVRVVPGVPREASNVDWCDKDPRTPSDAVASSPESSQPAASPLRPTADCPGMSAGGLPDGDGGHEASGMEDPAWDVPCVTATEGGQELAEGPSEMQTEEATVPQRRQADIQSQGKT
ncbi:uncharacterized protein LOC134402021 [Elgaria multicarinata webbii]|uniref:uncharacterized protein LOC134402021 n=1 Tax=Elgaria multicarinata webbii TaxID=159646 RepID=UPI002FCD0F43